MDNNDERESREDAYEVEAMRGPKVSDEQRHADAAHFQAIYAKQDAERAAWEVEHPELVAKLKAKQDAWYKEQEDRFGKSVDRPDQSLLDDLFGD